MVERMIELGIPESTAIEIYADFVIRGRENILLKYIEVVERECLSLLQPESCQAICR